MTDETVIIPIDLDTYILGKGVICKLNLNTQDIMRLIMPSKKFDTIEIIAQAVSDKINKDRMCLN